MMITRHILASLTISLTFVLTGCGGSGSADPKDGEPEPPKELNKVSTAEREIYLPKGVTSNTSVIGDFDGAMLFAGQDALTDLADASQRSRMITETAPTLSPRDMAGFVAQRPAPAQSLNASEALTSLVDSLSFTTISVGEQTFSQSNSVLASYTTTLDTAIKPTELANQMIQDIGMLEGGSVTNLVNPLGTEPSATNYRIFLGVIYTGISSNGTEDIVLLAAAVPENLVENYKELATGTTSTTNVTSKNVTLSSNTNSFTGSASNSNADFLFVIDDSGSMSNEQTALSNAVSEFESVITNSGLNYNLATITTSDPRTDAADIVRDSDGDGAVIADNDLIEFEQDVVAGTSGSATETGIFNAEHVLQSSALGDATDGIMTTKGFPRAGASLSVLIFSDEKSQYTRRSAGVEFDPMDNLFVDRGYTVHAIVDEIDSDYSQYDELADNTGGLKADIGEGDTFPTVMENIAQQAGGATSKFTLSQTPISSSIDVTVAGVSVNNNATNGWTYVQGSNAIAFHGDALPTEGQSVLVTYDFANTESPSIKPKVITAVDAKVVR